MRQARSEPALFKKIIENIWTISNDSTINSTIRRSRVGGYQRHPTTLQHRYLQVTCVTRGTQRDRWPMKIKPYTNKRGISMEYLHLHRVLSLSINCQFKRQNTVSYPKIIHSNVDRFFARTIGIHHWQLNFACVFQLLWDILC